MPVATLSDPHLGDAAEHPGRAERIIALVLVVAIVLTVMTAFAPAARWLEQSQLAPYFLVGGRAAIWLAPSELRHRFYQGLDYLRHAPSASDSTQPKPIEPAR